MLKNAFQKFVGTKTEIHSATLLLLQAKSHRFVRNEISPILYKHRLSGIEWSFLGILKERKTGCHYVDLSHQMGVEPPFITALVTKLQNLKLIKIVSDPDDGRAKIILLTPKGHKLIEKIEPIIEERIQKILKSVSSSDFGGYVNAMTSISELQHPSDTKTS